MNKNNRRSGPSKKEKPASSGKSFKSASGKKSYSGKNKFGKPDTERSFNRPKPASDNKRRRNPGEEPFEKSTSGKRPFSGKNKFGKPDTERSFNKAKPSSDNRRRRNSGEEPFEKSTSGKRPYPGKKFGKPDTERSFNRSKPASDNKRRRNPGEEPFGKPASGKRPFSGKPKFGKPDRERPFKGTKTSSDNKTTRDSGEGSFENSFSGKRPRSSGSREYPGSKNPKRKEEGRGDRKFSKKPYASGSKPAGKKSFRSAPETEGTENIKIPEYNLRKPGKAKTAPASSEAATGQIRLNRFIANSGVCSRREADSLIQAGEITVNGNVITEMGYKVNRQDDVRHNGRRLKSEKPVYVLLNKPKDFLTTTDDPQERRTVMSLVATACKERIYPVGRLDRNTTGLLLLTNDGELAEKLTHPSNKIKKVYQADLDKPISQEDFQKIADGFELEDGPVHVDEIVLLSKDKKSIGLEIHEGRNRIVRRIFEHLGYEVEKLDRVIYAGLTKKDLPRGKWRYLSEKEVIQLKFFK